MKRTISREFALIIAVMGLGVFAMSVLGPVLPLYLTSIDVSPEVLGFMFSVAMVGMLIGEGYWGWVADRIGLQLPLSVGTFVSGLVVLCFLLTQNIAALFAIFFFWGLVRSALFGPGRGYTGTTAPPLKKATYMALISVMLSASRSLGALPSGFIADHWGYRWVFLISGGISLLGSILVITGLRKARLPQSETPTDSVSLPDRQIAVPVYRRLTAQCAVAFFHWLGLGIMMTFLPLLATQVVGVSDTHVGILFTIGGIVTVVLAIPMGMLADRKGKRTLMIFGLLVSAGGMLGIAFVSSFPLLILFVVIRSLGMVMFSPAALGLLSDSVPLQRQSTVMGVYGSVCENTGVITGSALGGLIWSAWGPQVTFLTGAVSAGLGLAICLGLVREKTSRNSNPSSSSDDCHC